MQREYSAPIAGFSAARSDEPVASQAQSVSVWYREAGARASGNSRRSNIVYNSSEPAKALKSEPTLLPPKAR
jgi:hypothetical protein